MLVVVELIGLSAEVPAVQEEGREGGGEEKNTCTEVSGLFFSPFFLVVPRIFAQ